MKILLIVIALVLNCEATETKPEILSEVDAAIQCLKMTSMKEYNLCCKRNFIDPKTLKRIKQ